MAAKSYLMDFEDIVDFQLYGIAANFSNTSQLIYNLNKTFDLSFKRGEDLDILINKKETFYPLFEWEEEESGNLWYIIKNRAYSLDKEPSARNLFDMFALNPPLIPQHKEYNFLLKIDSTEEVLLPLKENSFISKITLLDTTKIKGLESLLF